jgi:soluble lytic murein transglycosylase
MLSRTFACCLLLALLLSPAATGPTAAAGGYNLTISIDSKAFSPFHNAFLLASFGEPRSAQALMPRPNPDDRGEAEQFRFGIRLLTELGSYAEADSLLALMEPVGGPEETFRYVFRRGYLNLLAGRYARALHFLDRADPLAGDGLTPHRDFLRMQANLGLGRPDAAADAGRLAQQSEVPATLSPEFELALVEALQLAGRPVEALDVVSGLKRRAHGAGEMAPLLELDYRLYVQSDDLAAARKTALKLARSYRRTDEAERVSVDLQGRLAAREQDNGELLAHADVMTAHGRYREAREIIPVLDRRQLTGRQREERSIVKATYYYQTGEYGRAIALSKPRFTVPAYRRSSMLILARSHRRSGHRKDAADVYSYFAKTFPNDSKAADALYVAASLYERSGDSRKAQETLYELRKSYPSSYFGKMASYRGAEHYFRVRDYDRSVAILQGALKRSRHTDETAMYYLATIYGKMGRNGDKQLLLSQLESLNPYSFYITSGVEQSFRRPPTTSTGEVALGGTFGLVSFLAGVVQRKESARRSILAAVSPGANPADFDKEAAACVERGRWFLEAGFRDWGESELYLASRRCADSPAALLELGEVYDHYGLPWHSIRLYQRVKDSIPWEKRREFSEEFAYLMYPVPYPVQVLENAAQYDLPPHLVYAMIREESHFDRKAISRVGALGLMQLMPETGRYVARELEMPELTEEGLLDPEVNIAFGIWYASSLFKRSSDNYLWMLAAYNAGPANANRWFRGRRAGAVEIVDGIDFKETRRYVQRIVESANVYHALYFDPQPFGGGSSR